MQAGASSFMQCNRHSRRPLASTQPPVKPSVRCNYRMPGQCTSASAATSASSAVQLNDGNGIPVLGLGVFRADAGESCKSAVLSALQLGYRHIDTAQIYQNEEAVGQAVRESGVPRREVFVTSKVSACCVGLAYICRVKM